MLPWLRRQSSIQLFVLIAAYRMASYRYPVVIETNQDGGFTQLNLLRSDIRQTRPLLEAVHQSPLNISSKC